MKFVVSCQTATNRSGCGSWLLHELQGIVQTVQCAICLLVTSVCGMIQRMMDLQVNDAELRGQFGLAVRLMSSVYMSAFTQHGPFTLFLATDVGFYKSLSHTEVAHTVR